MVLDGRSPRINGEYPETCFIGPTVFEGVSPDMAIAKEEVFGPVVCISKFSKIEEAIDLANTGDFALAACIWTKDEAKAKEAAGTLCAGSVWVNTYGMFFNELPYGGFKQSGYGKELGKEGFLGYTRLKNVIVDKTKDAKPLVNYWYGF
jgi:aldehyde dehydrogenase (NAD+)